jgi:hypothetical protein
VISLITASPAAQLIANRPSRQLATTLRIPVHTTVVTVGFGVYDELGGFDMLAAVAQRADSGVMARTAEGPQFEVPGKPLASVSASGSRAPNGNEHSRPQQDSHPSGRLETNCRISVTNAPSRSR